MIRLIVADIDGCLTAGEAQPFDHQLLLFIAELNRRARSDSALPAVTLCTGRQAPYVEAMMQAIDGHIPAIYENGCGLYFPVGYRFAEHAAITPERRAARDVIRARLQRTIVETGLGFIQPGKELSLTLYPLRADLSLQQLADESRHALGALLDGFDLYASVSSVELLPHGVDKGAGVEWLARETGIALSEMAGIGDAPADLTYLNKVGYSATPANAAPAVKQAVHYVSPERDSRGVHDILHHWLGATAAA